LNLKLIYHLTIGFGGRHSSGLKLFGFGFEEFFLPVLVSQMVPKDIGRNGKEPFFKRAGGNSEGADLGNEFQKEHTKQIIALGVVAVQPIKVAVTTTCVQIHQLRECFVAAGLAGGDYFF
jgi:hypothetical protein